MKLLYNMFLLSLLFLCVLSFAEQANAGTAIAPCAIYSKADAVVLFQEEVSEGVPSETVAPAGRMCRYTFSKDGDVYSLKLRMSDDAMLKEEGIFDSAADIMARQKRARQNNENAAKEHEQITAFGDEAFWEGSSLWLRKGQTLVVVTVKAPLDGTFANREEADDAAKKQNRALSLNVAETILSRLP